MASYVPKNKRGAWRISARSDVALILVLTLIGVGGLLFGGHLHTMRRSLSAEAWAQESANARASISALVQAPNFIPRLPVEVNVRYLIGQLQSGSDVNGVALESMSTWVVPATEKMVGRIGVIVELRGSYVQLKAAIAKALDRFPNLTVKTLNFRRRNQAIDVQAHVEFVALLRPSLPPASPTQ